MYGEKFYQLHAAQRQLLRPLNNLEKTGPSEIERIHNIRKQQTRFYWVFSWELMKSAIIFTPPSTGLRGILLSEAWGEFNDASALGRSLKLCQALHITNRDRKARIVKLASG